MDSQYDAWNQAIGRYFFNPANAGRTMFLTVNDTVLHRIGQNDVLPLHFETPEAAVNDFAATVRREIRQRGWTFGILRVDTYPIFLRYLAIQVLAVFKMRDDEAWDEKAYWGRLRELLHDTQARHMPLGLKSDRHQELWRKGLAHWVNDMQKERWGSVWLPQEHHEKHRKHVVLPKSQALLRLADLQRLPAFYRQVGFRPGEDLQGEDVQNHLQRYRNDSSLFQRHAINVFSDDERFASACLQIGDDLRAWDGGQSAGGKARLWLRLSAFDPPELSGGLTEGTARLQEILGRAMYQNDQCRVFRPIRDTYYVTILDAFNEIWEERRYARPGDDVFILVRSREAKYRHDQVRQFAADNATTHWYHADNTPPLSDQTMLRGLPTGWCALRFRVREDLPADRPDWLADWLRCDPLQTIGGLRLNKNTWMAGAGPTLVLRDRTVKTVLINGERYPVIGAPGDPATGPMLE